MRVREHMEIALNRISMVSLGKAAAAVAALNLKEDRRASAAAKKRREKLSLLSYHFSFSRNAERKCALRRPDENQSTFSFRATSIKMLKGGSRCCCCLISFAFSPSTAETGSRDEFEIRFRILEPQWQQHTGSSSEYVDESVCKS